MNVDMVQKRLVAAAGVSKEESLIYFGVAPLNARRDMAMLGLIHRSVIGLGPKHFLKFFRRKERL